MREKGSLIRGEIRGRLGIERLVFPRKIYCICCGSIIDETRTYSLCDSCVEKFHWITKKQCEKCGRILPEAYGAKICFNCRTNEHYFTKGYVCAEYGLYERAIMMDYKYNGKAYLGIEIGKIMAERIAIEEESIDTILCVPIHKKREKERGYNQSHIMAKVIAKELGWKYVPQGIIRTKITKPMKVLSAIERTDNVAQAFHLKSWAYRYVQDKNVLIVDDIYTTGSTIDSCAKEILKAQPKKITALTFAAGSNFSRAKK